MKFNRRDIAKGMIGSIALGASGCTTSGITKRELDNCEASWLPDNKDRFRIDTHLHLLNNKDIDAASFMARRGFNVDEDFDPWDGPFNLLANLFLFFIDTTTQTPSAETAYLIERMKKYNDPKKLKGSQFCKDAASRQNGVFFGHADGGDRITGFASNRIRNAALMMENSPKIDIFMVLMIDLAAGAAKTVDEIEEKARFYRSLHLASLGRFMPLISFNPISALRQARRRERRSYLDLVEMAITRWGFVGVKVHPSSGFNPWRNDLFGCEEKELLFEPFIGDSFSADDAKFVDEQMQGLFELCDRLEAPIVTHGSDGLAAVDGCMRRGQGDGATPPALWTNSPKHWIEALEKETGANAYPGLNLCIAHFANRFKNEMRSLLGGYDEIVPVDYFDPETKKRLKPSAWLQEVLNRLERPGSPNLYLDMSFMVHLALSKAAAGEDRDQYKPDFLASLVFTEYKQPVDENYHEAFTKFLSETEVLHDRVMYGSDWHMPSVAAFQSHDAYRKLIEAVIPEQLRDKVMGGNAIDFYGLRNGRNRQRLEAFYKHNALSLDDIPWIKRLEATPA